MLPLVTTMPAFSALATSGVKCGDKICKVFQYCSSFHEDCDDCSRVCDEGHNYDEMICKSQCQGENFYEFYFILVYRTNLEQKLAT